MIQTEALPIQADPEAVFATLLGEPDPFWLDSATGGGWSYIGASPSAVFRAAPGESGALARFEGWLAGRPVVPRGEVPFRGGAVGFLSYDLKNDIERLPSRAKDDLGHPAIRFGWYDVVAAFDASTGRWTLCWDEDVAGAAERAARWARRWARAAPLPPPAQAPPVAGGELSCTFSRAAYEDAVRRAKHAIVDGEVYQLNLSRRISLPWEEGSWDLYRRLRRSNAAPYAAYLPWGDPDVLSSSPELFLEVDGRAVRTRPIKGTAPRGADVEGDTRARRLLESSEKEAAELTMIVDLERNDLGRVCRPGSVRATSLGTTETYATVHHRVATVEGTLLDGVGTGALLRATFPGGSITGAPKIRAMELIDAIEPTARGVYTGAIGWIGRDGRGALNIAIRTPTVSRGTLSFQVGGGIVADSDSAREYEETGHKAAGMLRALGVPPEYSVE
ncbi:MAG: aminodeoxychorismate synthase component I [Planctomycetes bacterium]|nr:aminodeoxychorismate synthase component I [Planctomycetota bacterium]